MHFVKAAALLTFTLTVLGCSDTTTPSPSMVEHGLVSSPIRAGDLLTVNSILLAPVTLDNGVTTISESVNDELQKAFEAELNLAVARAEKGMRLDRAALASGRGGGSTDAVLFTTIHHYFDRVGSAIAVDRPAQVDFSMDLVRVRDGKSVWSADYHFRDRALTDNFLDTNNRTGGSGWTKAAPVLHAAFAAAARDFAEQRLQQFSPH